MSELEIERRDVGKVTKLSLRGSLDAATRKTFKSNPDCRPEGQSIVIDLSGLSFIDSTGLGCLIGTIKDFRQAGLGIVLAAPSAVTRQILDITMLSKVVPIAATCEEGAALLEASGEND